MWPASTEGRAFIESFEGLSLRAYLCPAGVWTIGYGHTGGVKAGDTLADQAAADALLAGDLVRFGTDVEQDLHGAPTTQHQFDAMLSLAFNIGSAGFLGSTVLRQHRAGNHAAAASAFGLWNKAMIGGVLQAVPGLTRRRAAEAVVYLTPEAETHPLAAMPRLVAGVMPQAVALPMAA